MFVEVLMTKQGISKIVNKRTNSCQYLAFLSAIIANMIGKGSYTYFIIIILHLAKTSRWKYSSTEFSKRCSMIH